MANEIDFNEVNELLYYDETSPSFLRWKVTRSNRALKDSVAGTLNANGYYRVRINGRLFLAHRVIWLLFNKTINPDMVIDHIDRDRANNNIKNLRLVSRKENQNNIVRTLPQYICISKTFPDGRLYYKVTLPKDPETNKRASKCGFNLDELIQWRDENIKLIGANLDGY